MIVEIKTLNSDHMFDYVPQPTDYIWPGFVNGTVGALIGDVGCGKSFFALEAAIAVGGGLNTDLMGLNPEKKRRVAFFSTEDLPSEINRRGFMIGTNFETQDKVWAADGIDVHHVQNLDLTKANDKKNIIDMMIDDDISLAIFDALSGIHKLDEYNPVDMIALSNALKEMAEKTNSAILVVMNTPTAGSRGAKIFLDRMRYLCRLKRMDEGRKQFEFCSLRTNYATCETKLPLKREFGGVFVLDKSELAENKIREKLGNTYAFI